MVSFDEFADKFAFMLPLPDESRRAILYRYWIADQILHGLHAELHQDEHLLIKTRPIHCSLMTGRVLQMHLQSLLEHFSRHSATPIAQFHEIVDLSLAKVPCPVAGCPLNGTSSLEELL